MCASEPKPQASARENELTRLVTCSVYVCIQYVVMRTSLPKVSRTTLPPPLILSVFKAERNCIEKTYFIQEYENTWGGTDHRYW